MQRIMTMLVTLFVASISTSAALAQQSVYVEPGRYEIEVASTGKVLDLRREDMRSVQQYHRGNVRNQQWDIERAEGNSYYIRSAENGAYLGIESAREGGRVVVTGSNRGDTWRFMNLGNGAMMIVHRSGMTLDLTNGNANDGTPIQVWSQARNANQQFRLVRTQAEAGYDSRNTNRAGYDEGYQAGTNDRAENLNRNYSRHRDVYDRYTEREFERGYNAGYQNGRYGRTNDDLNGMSQSERRTYEQGYLLGQQDARSGYNANYSRYNNRYNRWQESFFQRGYETGFNSVADNDSYDQGRLSPTERGAFDDGYRLGQRDARAGYGMDNRRYSNRYNFRQESFFQRGYERGYNNTRR